MPPYVKGSILTRFEIQRLIEADPPLIENLVDARVQIQPQGVDLTVRKVERFISPGRLGFLNKHRTLPHVEEISLAAEQPTRLSQGAYLVTFREVLHLPLWIVALGLPRSSLVRSGVTLHCGVWDAGFRGQSASLMVVVNPCGFDLLPSARILQLIFLATSREVDEGYQGVFSRR